MSALMIKLSSTNLSKEINFLVSPRDLMCKTIRLEATTILALNNAATEIMSTSNGRYQIMLTRGYVNWGIYRRLKALFAKLIYCSLFRGTRLEADALFGSNGHDDGYSVDIQLYDIQVKKKINLPWKNIFISSSQGNEIATLNKDLIALCEKAMNSAGFIAHPDVREKLQMHFRLSTKGNIEPAFYM